MPKKQKKSARIKKIVLIATLILASSTTLSLLYFKPWKKKEAIISSFNENITTHETIPPISDKYPIIQNTFQKNDLQCITTYNITETLPIYIKRYYPNTDETEYLILKRLSLLTDDINSLYELIQNSKEHIGKFEPQVVNMYSNKVKTRHYIWNSSTMMNKNPGYLTLGIWYRKKGENTEKLVGSVTISPQDDKVKIEKGMTPGSFGSYYVGDSKYTNIYGATTLCFEAITNHLVNKGLIKKRIILIIDKYNIGSCKVAEKLHFKKYNAIDHYPADEWPYPSNIENCFAYIISEKKWIQHNWHKKQVNRKKQTSSKKK